MMLLTQIIFDFRFLALLAVAGSLAGSLLCFLNVSFLYLNSAAHQDSDNQTEL